MLDYTKHMDYHCHGNFADEQTQPRFYLHLHDSIEPKTSYTALPRELFVWFEPRNLPICKVFKQSTPSKPQNVKLSFLRAMTLQHHQHQGNKRVS